MKLLSDTLVQQSISVITDSSGIKLTTEQFNNLIEKNTDLIDGIKAFGPDDTVERENLMDALAHELTGSYWPMFGDTEQHKEQFHKNLCEGIIRLGYKKVDL